MPKPHTTQLIWGFGLCAWVCKKYYNINGRYPFTVTYASNKTPCVYKHFSIIESTKSTYFYGYEVADDLPLTYNSTICVKKIYTWFHSENCWAVILRPTK